MTKKFAALIFALVLLLTACTKVPEKTVTGDVKEKTSMPEVVSEDVVSDDKEDIPNVLVPEAKNPVEEQEYQEDPKLVTPDHLILEIGGIITDGGEYRDEAWDFAEALKTANKMIVAEFTGGFPEYYSFLESIRIDEYEIVPFRISDEKISEVLSDTNIYFNEYDLYLANFKVSVGDGEYFSHGDNTYLLAFGQEPMAGGILAEFVPFERALDCLFVNWQKDSEYENFFIKEFLSLYRGELYEGKNYPEAFDFKNCVHLVTHLMARSGIYREYPPYSMEEINDFLTSSFDGNAGLSLIDERDFENWMAGAVYSVTDEDRESERLYGCSLAHGGTTAEHTIDKVEYDGDNVKSVYISLYADYSHFIKAKNVILTVENLENGLVKLNLLMIRNDTGMGVAYVSV